MITRAVWGGLVVFTVCAGNVILVGERSNDPPVSTPFPVTVIFCVPPALSVMVIWLVCKPTEVGVKVT